MSEDPEPVRVEAETESDETWDREPTTGVDGPELQPVRTVSSAPDAEDSAESPGAEESKISEEADEEMEADDESEDALDDLPPRGDERLSDVAPTSELEDREQVVRVFVDGIEALDSVTHGMLRQYREHGPTTPLEANSAVGGSGERQYAYARNRTLRTAGLIEHASGGRYRYRLADLVAEAFDSVDADTRTETVRSIETTTGLRE
jgi:hypothetical protein